MPLTVPVCLMMATVLSLDGIEFWIAAFAQNQNQYLVLGQIGLAVPYVIAAVIGLFTLLLAKPSLKIRSWGLGVVIGTGAVFFIAVGKEAFRLINLPDNLQGPIGQYLDLYSIMGAMIALGFGMFAVKVAQKGSMAFGIVGPKRQTGKRAIHGDSDWMANKDVSKLFPETGGIVIGERYRVDKDSVAQFPFDNNNPDTWGQGGKAPLLCFGCDFGSTHGLVFSGSGGFKTTSVVVPTALKYAGSMIVLDPSTEVSAMVTEHRKRHKQTVHILDPKKPDVGFNVLDWIGTHGNAAEEDVATVASWLIAEKSGISTGTDDFFRRSSKQLITAIIADVLFSDPEDRTQERSLREVRRRLAMPEQKLINKLTELYNNSDSHFVKEAAGTFINMTADQFSGIYGSAAKDTDWLSYDNYASLVSGSSFKTADITDSATSVFINIDLSALENHPGLGRAIVGAFLKTVYSRNGQVKEPVLFLLDEVARLGYMSLLETARDTGRKHKISLTMIFQSLGQLREIYGNRDATSKWFESASWVSFSAINDQDTAEMISKRCGMTTIEVNQLSRTSRGHGSSRTRSRQLSQRALILPHEIMQMRTDEQIIFTAGNPPIRCGRSIFFRRPEMVACSSSSGFEQKAITSVSDQRSTTKE